MSGNLEQDFEEWWEGYLKMFPVSWPEAAARAAYRAAYAVAYQAGRESLLGALLELAEETKDLHDAWFWSDATQEVIDSLASQEARTQS